MKEVSLLSLERADNLFDAPVEKKAEGKENDIKIVNINANDDDLNNISNNQNNKNNNENY